jgi:hypothetical protein
MRASSTTQQAWQATRCWVADGNDTINVPRGSAISNANDSSQARDQFSLVGEGAGLRPVLTSLALAGCRDLLALTSSLFLVPVPLDEKIERAALTFGAGPST